MQTTDMNREKAIAAARTIASMVVETIRETGPLGCPSGVLYSGLMGMGCTLAQYEALIGALVNVGRVRKEGHLLFAV